jgi:hypothetical protein
MVKAVVTLLRITMKRANLAHPKYDYETIRAIAAVRR